VGSWLSRVGWGGCGVWVGLVGGGVWLCGLWWVCVGFVGLWVGTFARSVTLCGKSYSHTSVCLAALIGSREVSAFIGLKMAKLSVSHFWGQIKWAV